MDSLLNLPASQDYIPLGINWVASCLLELVAALLDPVPLDIIMIPKDQLPTVVLVKGCNLLPQKLLHHQDQCIHLVIGFALCSGHVQQR